MTRSLLPAESLRTRILLTTAGTITLLMMVISWGILVHWRRTILAKESQHAIALARAFSVTVTEAMIYEENELAQSEGFLDNQIAGFLRQNPRLRYIVVAGPQGERIARGLRGPAVWGNVLPAGMLALTEPRTWFQHHDGMGWVQEVYCPLATGGRRWGGLALGIEAESVRAEVTRSFFLLFGLAVTVTGLMILLLWVLLGRLLRSLRDLVRAMDALDLEGDALPGLPARRDEIGHLFRRFGEMHGRLRRSRQELLAAQSQVAHAERLAAIGRLASGVAHELNNPINGVRNCVYAIRSAPDDRERTMTYLRLMDEGMEQAASVVGKLLGFARKQQPVRAPVALDEVVRTVARLLAFDLGRKRVTLELDLRDDLPSVVGDAQLLQEVAMNLLLNGVDAVEPGGYVRVSTRTAGDGQLALEVHDRGKGIRDEDLPHIFDPFFTTKDTGEGTGLGLSVSHGIVQAHGGRIDVTSAPGSGTTFTVTLPTGASA